MLSKTQVTVKTKLNKDDTHPVVTVLTLDWSGVTAEMLAGPATDTLVINLQGGWRRAKKIPAVHEVKVTDLIAKMGSRSQAPETVETLGAKITTLSKEDRDALIARLAAADKAESDKAKAAAAAAKEAEKSAKKWANKNPPPAAKGDGDTTKGANPQ